MSTPPAGPVLLSGREVLHEVSAAYTAAYRRAAQDAELAALVIRFTATPETSPSGPGSPGGPQAGSWAARMEASRVSAEQKRAIFTAVGLDTRVLVLADTTAPSDLAPIIDRANRDETVAAVIVQSPPPAPLTDLLNTIDPAKDLDALGLDSRQPRCATAEGILRLSRPYLRPDARIGVLGARGFVGSGVVTGLHALGHDPLRLDYGDDLTRLREVDIVISTAGSPGVLTAAHLRPGQPLVIDSGFTPTPTGPRGDLAAAAAHLPAALTPVPGGVGPVEMAVLAERVVRAHLAPDLAPWRYLGPTLTPASGAATGGAAAPGTTDATLTTGATATTAAADVARQLATPTRSRSLGPRHGPGPSQGPGS